MATVLPDTSALQAPRIPRPSPDRPPLRTSVFEFMQFSNTSLSPLFPAYLQRGAIVPCATMFIGAPGAEYGHFFHENTEEEVGLVIADHGAVKGTGTVMVAPLLHGVNAFLKDSSDPESFLLIVITQRQNERNEQKERVFFRCGCNQVLFEHSFDSTPPDTFEGDVDHAFTSLIESSEAAERFNADETNRTCSRCGKVAAPFPVGAWGWTQHSAQYRAVARARAELTAAKPERGAQ
jgi:hypothetical protein